MSLLDLAPPHSVEAEQGVIGGLMLDNSTWDLHRGRPLCGRFLQT